MPHICISESGQHWFRWWLVTYSAPSHYLNQCCVIVNWKLTNKLQWNFNQNTNFLIHEIASEKIVCEMVAILSKGRWVKINKKIFRLVQWLSVTYPTLPNTTQCTCGQQQWIQQILLTEKVSLSFKLKVIKTKQILRSCKWFILYQMTKDTT